MVTCTRAHCYRPDICECASTRSKKRKRSASSAELQSCNALRVSAKNLLALGQRYRKIIIGREANKNRSAGRGGREDARKISQDPADRSLLTPSRSISTSDEDTNARSLQGYAQSDTRMSTAARLYHRPTEIAGLNYRYARKEHGSPSGMYEYEGDDLQEQTSNATKAEDNHTSRLRENEKAPPWREDTPTCIDQLSPKSLALDQECVPSTWLSSACLGPSITPPVDLSTPPEYVAEISIDHELLPNFLRAYEMSVYADKLRGNKYGEDVAAEYRRGFTPEEDRQRWQFFAEQRRADADATSDSDDS